MTTIAIFRTGGIGDVILSTVAINILRDAIPGVNIHWFGYPSTTPFIRQAFPFVHTYNLDRQAGYKANIDLVKENAPGTQLVLDLQRSARTAIIGSIAAHHFRCAYVTWNKFSIHRTLLVTQSSIRGRNSHADFLKQPLPHRYEAMAACTLHALRKLGIQHSGDSKIYMPGIKVDVQKSNTAYAINMGALYKSKELPRYKLEKIADNIIALGAKRIYLLGDGNKYDAGEDLVNSCGVHGLFSNLCGRTTLWEAAQILASCVCSVSNDSALAHLSEAVGTPVVMFFGPTHEKFGYRPHLPRSKSFSTNIACRPCTKGGHTTCRYGDFKCLHDIAIQPVLDHLSLLHAATS
jgi:ADP-heptose:LPS heptosyltransferase